MVEEQKARISDALSKFLEDINKSHLRVMQAKMLRCAATCCDDSTASDRSVQECVSSCGHSMQLAQNYVEQEMIHFQDRLQRCIMTCNDKTRDKMGPDPKESEVLKYQNEFDGCVKKCIDSHLELLPGMMKKMKTMLSKKEVFNSSD